MRIIAGSARGKRLIMPREKATRPFLEMARGALFNILGPAIRGARILDLFAGSGALGLEALSRGAATATFVERSNDAVGALHENIQGCRVTDQATLLHEDAFLALPRLDPDLHFDIIFCDPPFVDTRTWYAAGGERLEALTAAHLTEAGTVVFRLEVDAEAGPSWAGVPLWKERTYGRSRLCLYRHG